MTFIIALAISLIFGAGAFLVLQRNLIRVVIGIVLISNAANIFIVAAGITRGQAPIYPLPEGVEISDPLVQAMVLTALVISSSVTALLLALSYRLYTTHSTIDLEDISRAETEAAEALERDEYPEHIDPERKEPV
ncbi:MAG: sodium:proton antiporter [Actinomycetota bacterium]|nr:sodium:proton antiporter [Actinomycetota bacterium]